MEVFMGTIKIDYSLVLQAANMLQNKDVTHPIITLVEFDMEKEQINLINETTNEVYYTEVYQ
jgi:hypothetical protein